jgi:hypothetical protein
MPDTEAIVGYPLILVVMKCARYNKLQFVGMIARVQLCLGVLAGPFIAAERGVFVTILAVHNKAQQEFLVKLTEHTTYVAVPIQSVIISLAIDTMLLNERNCLSRAVDVLPHIRTRRKLGEDEHEHLCIQILLTLEAVLKQDTTFSEVYPLVS